MTVGPELRRFYAEELRAVAGLRSAELVDAFAAVPRERFLGPGPWLVLAPDGQSYRGTEDADPAQVHHNVVVALDPSRHIHNGQPGTIALWLDAADVRRGDRVLHLGCGTGYYSAVLAEVVGPGGRVVAVEIDAGLAERARASLASWPQVEVRHGDGHDLEGRHDVIVVHAGTTHVPPAWLDALAPGGRLVLPLAVSLPGAALVTGFVARVEETAGALAARPVCLTHAYPCEGFRDPAVEPALRHLLEVGGFGRLRAVRRDVHAPVESCLVHVEGACLTA